VPEAARQWNPDDTREHGRDGGEGEQRRCDGTDDVDDAPESSGTVRATHPLGRW
jgi:hypothetical protein